ncbi:MAG TPA: AMIN domain-containing protein [Polyangiaceae bacterium]|jgi:hypothetical protein
MAQSTLSQKFQEGFSLLRFEPAPAGDRFFAVPDGSVPGNDSSPLRAMVLAHMTLGPSLSRTDAAGQTSALIKRQYLVHLDAGYFPTSWLFLHVDQPLVAAQSGDTAASPSGAAVADTRLGARFGVVGSENAGFSFGPGLDVWLPTGSQAELAGDGKFRVEPLLAASGRADFFVWSTRVGYQFRRHLDTESLEIGNNLTLGAAAGVLLFDDVLQVGPELYGSLLTSPARGGVGSGANTALEGLLGARVHVGDIVIGAAAGPGLSTAPGTAPRALLSVAFAPQAKYERAAPVQTPPAPAPTPSAEPEPAVAPPTAAPAPEPEPAEPAAAEPTPPAPAEPAAAEAPAPKPPPPDSDGDGVPDNKDACPKQAGVESTNPKHNGCPEPPAPAPRAAARPVAAPPQRHAATDRAQATFSGFRSLPNGGAVVFVELSSPVSVSLERKTNTLTYTLANTTVPVRNNRNPLLTQDFASVVESARLVSDKKATRLVIRLNTAVEPQQRMVARGSHATLEIEFPPPAAR